MTSLALLYPVVFSFYPQNLELIVLDIRLKISLTKQASCFCMQGILCAESSRVAYHEPRRNRQRPSYFRYYLL